MRCDCECSIREVFSYLLPREMPCSEQESSEASLLTLNGSEIQNARCRLLVRHSNVLQDQGCSKDNHTKFVYRGFSQNRPTVVRGGLPPRHFLELAAEVRTLHKQKRSIFSALAALAAYPIKLPTLWVNRFESGMPSTMNPESASAASSCV